MGGLENPKASLLILTRGAIKKVRVNVKLYFPIDRRRYCLPSVKREKKSRD